MGRLRRLDLYFRQYHHDLLDLLGQLFLQFHPDQYYLQDQMGRHCLLSRPDRLHPLRHWHLLHQ